MSTPDTPNGDALSPDPTTVDEPQGFAALRSLPRRPMHPLRVYLAERGVTLDEAARVYLDGLVSLRSLKDVVAWRRELPEGKRRALASALGYDDPDAILPRRELPDDEPEDERVVVPDEL